VSAWVPDDVDPNRPSAARIYDYLLGGAHNFAADREMADKLLALQPNVRAIARRNRAFLRRAVLFMLEAGTRQFLDLGSGIPTVGNVHEVAQEVVPDVRVVYVDYESVAVEHSRLLLEGNDQATIVEADIRRPDDVMEAEGTRRLLDFTEPIGILAVTLGHYIPDDDDPAALFARYRDAVPAGSHLALTHLTNDFAAIRGEEIVETMSRTRDQVFPRTRDQVLELFHGFDLVPPGLVTTSRWRPDSPDAHATDPEEDGLYAGVGRKAFG
jgi:hypothetical protein